MRGARRQWIQGVGLACAAWAPIRPALAAGGQHGRVEPPQAVPNITVIGDDGRRTTLAQRLVGRISAMQLMFTACSSTCPIQGATFAAVQELIAARPRLQLLSLSVDALGDDPQTLGRWRQRFAAGAGWRAVVPIVPDLDSLLDWVGRGPPRAVDSHSTQVLLFNEQARLVLRTVQLPDPQQIAALLIGLDQSRPLRS